MVTLREDAAKGLFFVENNVKKTVFAWSPHNHLPRYVWLKTTAADITPGMPVIRGITVGIEKTCAKAAGSSIKVFGIAELDPKQIDVCTDTYATGDLIPVIPIYGNEGCILRNLPITDPSADILPDSGFQSGAGCFDVGDATGAIYVRSQHFVADADNPSYLVAYIAPSLDVAA